MSKANSQTMTIRLPVEVGKSLMELRNSKNLATVGSAFKYYIDQEIEARKDTRLIKIEEMMERVIKGFEYFEDRMIRTDEKGITTSLWLATLLESFDGKGGSKDFLKRLEAVNEIPVKKLFQEREKRRAKVKDYKREQAVK